MEYEGRNKALALINSLAHIKEKNGMDSEIAIELSIDRVLERYEINRNEFVSRIAKEYIERGQALIDGR